MKANEFRNLLSLLKSDKQSTLTAMYRSSKLTFYSQYTMKWIQKTFWKGMKKRQRPSSGLQALVELPQNLMKSGVHDERQFKKRTSVFILSITDSRLKVRKFSWDFTCNYFLPSIRRRHHNTRKRQTIFLFITLFSIFCLAVASNWLMCYFAQ